jgi:O-antigen/teichoic acid export membrane protein
MNSLMRERLSGVAWSVADQTVVSASNFLTIYLLARSMEIGEFGLYMAAWISLLFLVSLQSAMITEPHNVLGPAQTRDQYRRLTTVLATVLLAASVALALLLIAAGALTHTLAGGPYGRLMTLLGIIAVPWMGQEYVRRVLYTLSETRAACANDAVSYGLQVTGIMLLIGSTPRPSAAMALAILGGSSFVALLVGSWQLRDHVAFAGLRLDAGRSMWREAAGFGKWLLARNLVSWCGQYGHGWLLLGMLGPAALGTYKAAEHLLNIVNPLRLAACSYLPPRGSRVYAEGGIVALRSWVRDVYRSVGIAFAACVVVLMLFAKPLLDMAYGDRFGSQSLEWIIVLAGLLALITFGRVPLEMAIAATKQSRPLFWVHLWSVPLLVVTGPTLIHVFGIFGVPISGIIIGGVLLVLTCRALRRITGAATPVEVLAPGAAFAHAGSGHAITLHAVAATIDISGHGTRFRSRG